MAPTKYTLLYKKSVEKELRKLPQSHRAIIVEKIVALADNPQPAGSVKLRGSKNLYRIRYTDYRIIYHIENDRLIVLVIKVGHRKEIYRDP